MGKHHLGEFEEIVLLTVALLHGKAYGVAILDEMEDRLNRHVSIGSLQTVLVRLEKKGWLVSKLGEATSIRGGKRKRFFSITKLGRQEMETTKNQRLSLWKAIPKFVLEDEL